jgi:hypothetical protein
MSRYTTETANEIEIRARSSADVPTKKPPLSEMADWRNEKAHVPKRSQTCQALLDAAA